MSDVGQRLIELARDIRVLKSRLDFLDTLPKAAGSEIVTAVPAARVYHDADQTLANNTETTITFNSEKSDNDGIHDPSTNPERLTCKTAGWYFIWGNLQFAASSTGDRQSIIYLNGTTISIGYDSRRARAIGPTHGIVSTSYNLAVDDYVILRASQNSGGNLAITANNEHSPVFEMIWLGTDS